jgi:hypothetical protein
VTAAAVVADLRIEPDPAEVRRFLGYTPGRVVPERTEERLAALWTPAQALLRPRGAWALVGRDDAARAGMPEPTEVVGVAVCTVGDGIESEAARCVEAGALHDALLLEAIGSTAAEAAADALNLRLCTVAAVRGLDAAPRVSPGYGGWDTAGQDALLALLPIAALGIALTSGSMMVPRKSVSFAVALAAPGRLPVHAASRCARCGLLHCRHRLAPPDCG